MRRNRIIVVCMGTCFGLLVTLAACGPFARPVAQPARQAASGGGTKPLIEQVVIPVTYYPTPTRSAFLRTQAAAPITRSTKSPSPTPVVDATNPPVVDAQPTSQPEPILPTATAPVAAPVPISVPASDGSEEGIRQEMLALHNVARTQAGLPPLKIDLQLQQAAQAHAAWLSQKPVQELWSLGNAGHNGEAGSGYVQRIIAAGYPAPPQNVNENYGTFSNATEAFDWWMNDPVGAPGHRPQILSPLYTDIGIGVVKHSSGLSTVFIINFGAR